MNCRQCNCQRHTVSKSWQTRVPGTHLPPARATFTHRPRPAVACAAADSSQQPAYPYNSGDGRTQKATLEHIFTADAQEHFEPGSSSASAVDQMQAPWGVGWQMSERNIMWNDDLKMRLIKRLASEELHISDQELDDRLQTLYNLLPDLASRLLKAPPQRVAQLAANTDTICMRLLQLRAIFPQANASALVCSRLSLLLDDDMTEVEAAAARLRQLLPGIQVDKLVECHPQVLDIQDFELALEDAKRLMPHINVTTALRNNPELILSMQKGKSLIPYDEPWPIKKP